MAGCQWPQHQRIGHQQYGIGQRLRAMVADEVEPGRRRSADAVDRTASGPHRRVESCCRSSRLAMAALKPAHRYAPAIRLATNTILPSRRSVAWRRERSARIGTSAPPSDKGGPIQFVLRRPKNRPRRRSTTKNALPKLASRRLDPDPVTCYAARQHCPPSILPDRPKSGDSSMPRGHGGSSNYRPRPPEYVAGCLQLSPPRLEHASHPQLSRPRAFNDSV